MRPVTYPGLPTTLRAAAENFSDSDLVRDAFGVAVHDHYTHFYRSEVRSTGSHQPRAVRQALPSAPCGVPWASFALRPHRQEGVAECEHVRGLLGGAVCIDVAFEPGVA